MIILRPSTSTSKTNAKQGATHTALKIMSGRAGRSTVAGWCRLVFILMSLPVALSRTCPSGTHFSSLFNGIPDTCVPCPDKSFMPDADHHEEWCKDCDEITDPGLEILMSPCNKTHDAVIHCVEGYYRDRNPHEKGSCHKCTNCRDFNMYTGQPCGKYNDTICCMDENFDVAPNHHGVPKCRERPWFCRRGQYFDTNLFRCLPCPSNTFMPVDFHVRHKCFKCRDYTSFEVNSPLHTVIVQPCNSTHDTVLNCKDGFFIKYSMGYRKDAIGCSPCTNCSKTHDQYEVQTCDKMNDTVCCPELNMTVVHMPNGPACIGPSSSCGNGLCKQHDTRRRSVRCVPCGVYKEGEDVTNDEIDDHFKVSQRQLTSGDNLSHPASFTNKTCDEYDKLKLFKILFIVFAALFGTLLSANVIFVILYH